MVNMSTRGRPGQKEMSLWAASLQILSSMNKVCQQANISITGNCLVKNAMFILIISQEKKSQESCKP